VERLCGLDEVPIEALAIVEGNECGRQLDGLSRLDALAGIQAGIEVSERSEPAVGIALLAEADSQLTEGYFLLNDELGRTRGTYSRVSRGKR
jgi:hypothetical protein